MIESDDLFARAGVDPLTLAKIISDGDAQRASGLKYTWLNRSVPLHIRALLRLLAEPRRGGETVEQALRRIYE